MSAVVVVNELAVAVGFVLALYLVVRRVPERRARIVLALAVVAACIALVSRLVFSFGAAAGSAAAVVGIALASVLLLRSRGAPDRVARIVVAASVLAVTALHFLEP